MIVSKLFPFLLSQNQACSLERTSIEELIRKILMKEVHYENVFIQVILKELEVKIQRTTLKARHQRIYYVKIFK